MPQFQTIAALLIVAGAVFFLIRRFYFSLKKGDSASCNCSCGCSGRNVDPSCGQKDIQGS